MATTLPRGKEAFFEKQKEIVTKVTPRLQAWGVNMAWVNDTFTPSRLKYEQLYEVCLDPLTRTQEDLILRDEAEAIYRANLAHLIEIIKAISGLTEAQLEAYGIAAAKGGPHNDKTPTDSPSLTFLLNMIREIGITRGSNPPGVSGVEILMKVGGERPASINDFPHSDFYTRSTRYKFDENQRFMLVYFIARYKSKTGKAGPWSEIYTVVIP